MKKSNTLSMLKEQLINEIQIKGDKRISSVRKQFRKKTEVNENIQRELISTSVISDNATTYNRNSTLSTINNSTNSNNFTYSLPTTINKIENNSSLDNVKIIGITGSRGKSTTAFIVHEYLKSLGYKSILYSSVCVDSPVSYADVNEVCETPLKDNNMLLNILEEAESYEADYIVLEINESAIAKGLTKNIPFAIKALTNIEPKHNDEIYTSEEYVKLKKSFFEDEFNEVECTCIFGLTGDITREEFNQLLKLNNHPKITYGTKYISEVRNADYTNLDCLLYEMINSLSGLSMKIRVKEHSYDLMTSMILPHNALNLTCAIAITEALNLFNSEAFNKCIKDIKIPGREEIIKINNRTIVIGLYLMPALENFKRYQLNQEINKIRVVTGAVGTGFATWNKEFSAERFISKRKSARSFAMNYAKEYADYVYITSNDNASEDPLAIATELQGYLNNEIPSKIIVDRQEAIKKALQDSEMNDVIYISGRGNRNVLCDSADTFKLLKDRDAVEQAIHDLKW